MMRLLALTACVAAAAAAGRVGYTLSTDGLSYAVTLDGATWLKSSAAAYTIRSGAATLSTANGGLTADGAPTAASGSDALGPWSGSTLSFNSGLFQASFKIYAARNVLSLGQTFPRGLAGMALAEPAADADLTTAFPAFSPPAPGKLAYVSWANCMCNGNVGIVSGASRAREEASPCGAALRCRGVPPPPFRRLTPPSARINTSTAAPARARTLARTAARWRCTIPRA